MSQVVRDEYSKYITPTQYFDPTSDHLPPTESKPLLIRSNAIYIPKSLIILPRVNTIKE